MMRRAEEVLLVASYFDSFLIIATTPRRVSAAKSSFEAMSSSIGGQEPTTNACMRSCPPDALPILGAIPTVKNAYVAAGHNW